MPSPNVQFAFPNFAFDGSDFYNIDHTTNRLIRKDSNGNNTVTFPIISNDNIDDLNNTITALKFTGTSFPLGIVQGNANLWSLESEIDSSGNTTALSIRRFGLVDGVLRYSTTRTPTGKIRPDVFRYVTKGVQRFKSSSFAVEYHITSSSGSITSGVSFLYLPDVTRLVPNSRIILGPSTSSSNEGKVEENEVVSIGAYSVLNNGYKVNLRYPIAYNYNMANTVVYQNYIYLFNDFNYETNDTQGSLYKIRAIDGSIVAVDSGSLYKNVTGAIFSPTYNRILFSSGNQVLYMHPDSFTFTSSVVLDNINSTKNPALSIYDIDLSDSFIYRLQSQYMDFENNILQSFNAYSYVKTNITQNTASISVRPANQSILANEYDSVFIEVQALDQYGFPVEGEILTISAVAINGGEGIFELFDSDDPQDQVNTVQKETGVTGRVRYLYRSGPVMDIVKLVVTAASNDTTSYSFIYQYGNASSRCLVKQVGAISDRALVKQAANITSKSSIFFQKNFGFPSSHGIFHAGTVLNGFRDMYNGDKDIDWAFWGDDYKTIVGDNHSPPPTSHPIYLAYPKLISQSLEDVEASCTLYQLSGELSSSVRIPQVNASIPGRALVRQVGYISSSTTVSQFDFILLFIPEPLAVKVSRDTQIYAKIRDIPGTNINVSTLSFQVNGTEVVDLVNVNYVANQYLELTYTPPIEFDFGERVTVYISFYDHAPTPNLIEIPYYFDIIEDYKAPVIYNIFPMKNEIDIELDTSISFDISDEGSGVNIDTLLLYVNNFQINNYVLTSISEGYHVEYTPSGPFKNMQDISVFIEVLDNRNNKIVQNYYFITKPSSPPEIEMVRPFNCGYYSKRNQLVVFEIYSTGDGVRLETIKVTIDGVDRRFITSPIIKRIE